MAVRTLNVENVKKCGGQAGMHLGNEEAQGLYCYLKMLMKWNKRMNLVGPKDWETVLTTLVVDSFYLARLFSGLALDDDMTILDIGAGAGLPGIPLRIFWTRGEYWLVEPRKKRAVFMEQVLAELRLEKTRVKQARVEELGPGYLQADIVLSRAFMDWRDFLQLSVSISSPGAYCVVFSLKEQPGNIPSGWTLEQVEKYLVEKNNRYFWLFSREGSSS